MDHHDHVTLLRGAVTHSSSDASGHLARGSTMTPANAPAVWADFGSGGGAFTRALRELLGADAEIYSVDQSGKSLEEQARSFRSQFPISNIHFLQADFRKPLALPALDGIVMANALHFSRNGEPQEKILRQLHAYLKRHGAFVLVEYNVDSGNPWVPYPLSFQSFRSLALRVGFEEPRLLATMPSRFLLEIYSALATKNE